MRRKVMLKEKSRCCYKTFTGWVSSIKSCYAANDALQDGAACHAWPGDTAPRLKCSSFVCRSARADVSPPTRLVKEDFGTITFPSSLSFMHTKKKKNKETKLTSQDCVTILHRQWDFIHKLFYTDRTKYLLLFCVFITFFWFMYSDNATDQPSIDSWWSVWKKPGRENDLAAK